MMQKNPTNNAKLPAVASEGIDAYSTSPSSRKIM
jgi:hypothetical protein